MSKELLLRIGIPPFVYEKISLLSRKLKTDCVVSKVPVTRRSS
ncbi:unnamed protein product [Acanthoscelides obtectus]|uniref:Uncharacterized protein n=1 Tax=Acanthoscelides obtectus TaxID=200917 RepID=A0A9P0JN74_ACAOB|nr:unnamed protein product [Acanthoscelides obtectus]CAK1639923.1 hypothetical protein AOBTE_LOCUS11453 [Acanthoscelides obtectus]